MQQIIITWNDFANQAMFTGYVNWLCSLAMFTFDHSSLFTCYLGLSYHTPIKANYTCLLWTQYESRLSDWRILNLSCGFKILYNGSELRGPGGPRPEDGKNRVSCFFLIEVNPNYQMLFTVSKIIVLSQSNCILKSWKYRKITVHARTLIAFSQKWPFLEFQNLSSPTFVIQSSWNLI